ncbi:hypothetical protein GNI_144500 [Gregarina niphandrodes]|uniref:Cytidine deaminase n=1 Tax=Gregarina niphandrodes TaxID=110365 RepID=A0A023AZW5_GRENI|nr:hypothetical protein GNI_144500 [Gregarina niphandrodes]EZG44714.1 hypothetical protein GNI_144500 [Gregarina niphandrodes]|eukprot:XP_011134134.1 hypothetical protein GNI_144500 [Gregarina niphandrodes]
MHPAVVAAKPPTWRVTKEYWLLRQYQDLPEDTKFLVGHMRQFAQDYQAAKPDTYWHRKSGQVVLAVLLLRIHGKLQTVRGINSELSLPSGSVCAERAAIAAALAQHLSIARSDFVSIAVLAPNNANPIKPCGVCSEWIKKIEEACPTFSVITFTSTAMDELLEYSSVTVSEEVIDHVPDHLKGNWICKCGFQLNRAQQVYCSHCKQFRFRFKSHLQQTRVLVLKAVKHENYPNAETPRPSNGLEASPVPPTTNWLTASDEEASEEVRRTRRRGSLDLSQLCQQVVEATGLAEEVTLKTLKDLLSLQFIARPEGSCEFQITSLGSDFLEATQRLA